MMKAIIFTCLISCFLGCELLDLESKRVSYTVDESKVFVYYSNLEPGKQFNDFSFITRASFDIPQEAEVEKFIIKDVYLDFEVQNENDCDQLVIDYVFDTDFNGFIQRISDAKFTIDLPAFSNGIGEIFMNNRFTDNFTDIRNAVANVIKNDEALGLKFRMYCDDSNLQTDVRVRVTVAIIAEYENCEMLPQGSDLPEC
jgi:hypothetical protein